MTGERKGEGGGPSDAFRETANGGVTAKRKGEGGGEGGEQVHLKFFLLF